jgi:hypothetical protein
MSSPAGCVSLGQKSDWLSHKLNWLEATRSRQLIVEDVMGFAFLRTGLDLMRGYINGSGGLNIPAGSERLVREGASIATDNILSGITAQWIGNRFFDKKGKGFSNGFSSYPVLELFQNLLDKRGIHSESHFVDALAEHFAPSNDVFRQGLQAAWQHDLSSMTKAQKSETLAQQAKILAQQLKQTHFDLEEGVQLPDLLDDLHLLKVHLIQKPSTLLQKTKWRATAREAIQQTLRAKNWKLGAIALGLGTTALVPMMNVGLTKALFNINFYPGEIGLRDPQQLSDESPPPIFRAKSFASRYFPYITKQNEQGNALPLTFALLPLVFAFGLFDIAQRRWINVFAKNGFKALRNAFDFQKGWPYTSPQQMASMFALLISSRLLCARSDNEYRERMVDSFAGWGVWIFGTPLLKVALGRLLDKGLMPGVRETCLRQGKRLRTTTELDLLQTLWLQNEKSGKPFLLEGKTITKEMLHSSRKAGVWLSAFSMATTIIGLGVIEPLIGILWTKSREQNKQAQRKAAAEKKALQRLNPNRLSPLNQFRMPPVSSQNPYFNSPSSSNT